MPGVEPVWMAGKRFLISQESWPNFWRGGAESSESRAPVTPGRCAPVLRRSGRLLPSLASRPTKVSRSCGRCVPSSSPPSVPSAPLRLKTPGYGAERSCPGCRGGAPGAVRGEAGARPAGLREERARGVQSPSGPLRAPQRLEPFPRGRFRRSRPESLALPTTEQQKPEHTNKKPEHQKKKRTRLIQRPRWLRCRGGGFSSHG